MSCGVHFDHVVGPYLLIVGGHLEVILKYQVSPDSTVACFQFPPTTFLSPSLDTEILQFQEAALKNSNGKIRFQLDFNNIHHSKCHNFSMLITTVPIHRRFQSTEHNGLLDLAAIAPGREKEYNFLFLKRI